MKTHLTLSATTLASLVNAPGTAGEITAGTSKLIGVSTSASDTPTAALVGNDYTLAAALESLALTGQVEKETTTAWASITRIGLSAVAVGAIQFRRRGTAATGDITVNTAPTEGQTLILGLNSNTRTYTFRSPGRVTVQCPAVADLNGSGTASYVTFTLNGTNVSFWFSTGTATDPGIGTRYMVDLTGLTTDAEVATALRTSIGTNYATVIATVSTNTVTVTGVNLGTLAVAQTDTGSSFTLATVQAGTTLAANQIRALYHTDGATASTANISDYIIAAINHAGGTAGTYYSSTTTQHAQVSATGGSGDVALTDRLQCDRFLGWAAISGTFAASCTITQMTGGANGEMVCEIAPGQAGAGTSITLDSYEESNVPAGFIAVFDTIQIHGRAGALWIQTDATFGSDGLFTLRGGPSQDIMADISADVPSTGTTPVSVSIPAGNEYIQVELTANTNGGAVWAALVY